MFNLFGGRFEMKHLEIEFFILVSIFLFQENLSDSWILDCCEQKKMF